MTTKAKTSTLEKASVLVALFILLALATYFVIHTNSQRKIQTEHIYAANTPAIGSVVAVKTISTGWAKKEGEETLYPVATITLDSAACKPGSIRVFFKRDVGVAANPAKSVGDSNSFKITNGVFPNGENSMTITCTQGLPDMANFLGYCAQEDFRWTVEVLEAGENSNEFREFAHAPIETLILE